MINVGIVGFGNLGQAVYNELKNNENFNIIGIFSRRKLSHPKTFMLKDYINFVGEIDIMIMCGGSQNDLPIQSKEFAQYFNIIDTFDNHSQIQNHYKSIKQTCEKHKTNAIVCCGWDPGLFSCFRVLFSSILNHQECFYGKGISLGHTNALKNIFGISDAIQFTLPIKKAVKKAKQGNVVNNHKHLRLCYVVSSHNKKQISDKIKNTPNYFKNQKVKVKFVSQKKLNNHLTFAHKGQIISVYNKQEKISMNLKMKTTSNPVFTAKIIVAYLNALKIMVKNNLNTALTPLQIPFNYLSNKSDNDIIFEFC